MEQYDDIVIFLLGVLLFSVSIVRMSYQVDKKALGNTLDWKKTNGKL